MFPQPKKKKKYRRVVARAFVLYFFIFLPFALLPLTMLLLAPPGLGVA